MNWNEQGISSHSTYCANNWFYKLGFQANIDRINCGSFTFKQLETSAQWCIVGYHCDWHPDTEVAFYQTEVQ